MYKGNNFSMRGLQPQSEFCAVCSYVVVEFKGQICRGCATKAQKRMQCVRDNGIVTRIIKGQPACVQKGGEVVHEGISCAGCRFEGV